VAAAATAIGAAAKEGASHDGAEEAGKDGSGSGDPSGLGLEAVSLWTRRVAEGQDRLDRARRARDAAKRRVDSIRIVV